jgi:hypothetical protein
VTEHVPTAWQIQYWNGSQWVDVSSISHQVRWDMRAENYYTPDYYGAVATEDVFHYMNPPRSPLARCRTLSGSGRL